MKLAVPALRGLVGGLFIGHGAQKLFGSFDGPGLDAAGAWLESLGVENGRLSAMVAGGTEVGSGALLAAGLATPLASAGLISVLAEAIRRVHRPNGPWITSGGWEYSAVLIALLVFFAEQGPGPLSLDRALGTERRGARWGFAALAAGVAGPSLLPKVLAKLAPTAAESGNDSVSASDAPAG